MTQHKDFSIKQVFEEISKSYLWHEIQCEYIWLPKHFFKKYHYQLLKMQKSY